MSAVLGTSAQITSFVKGLSDFIIDVRITEVFPPWGFYFRVKVPFWYKILFSKSLSKKITEELKPRMIVGIRFEFDVYSDKLFG